MSEQDLGSEKSEKYDEQLTAPEDLAHGETTMFDDQTDPASFSLNGWSAAHWCNTGNCVAEHLDLDRVVFGDSKRTLHAECSCNGPLTALTRPLAGGRGRLSARQRLEGIGGRPQSTVLMRLGLYGVSKLWHRRSGAVGDGDPKVFISHSHANYRLAAAVRDLFAHACDCRHTDIRCSSAAASRLPAGEAIVPAVEHEIENCRVVVPILTRQSCRSKFVNAELIAAWCAGKPIVPVFAGAIRTDELPRMLQGRRILNLAEASERLEVVEAVAHLLGVDLQPVSSLFPLLAEVDAAAIEVATGMY